MNNDAVILQDESKADIKFDYGLIAKDIARYAIDAGRGMTLSLGIDNKTKTLGGVNVTVNLADMAISIESAWEEKKEGEEDEAD